MTQPRTALRIVLLLLSAAAITACSKTSPTETGSDSVTVVSIQPPSGTTLQAGSPVTFAATVDYHLSSAPSGTIAIVIEDQNFRNLSSTVPQPSVSVAGGIGTRTLSDRIVVPSSNVATVHVIFPLVRTGDTSTQIVAAVDYPVAQTSLPGQVQAASVP